MRRLVQDFVRACDTCQRYKSEHLHPTGLLLPLPVPQGVWTDIGLDFVEALPRTETGKLQRFRLAQPAAAPVAA